MIICLDTWQAWAVAIVIALIFGWAGFATSKVFDFSKKNLELKRYINALKMRIRYSEDEEKEILIKNGRTDGKGF